MQYKINIDTFAKQTYRSRCSIQVFRLYPKYLTLRRIEGPKWHCRFIKSIMTFGKGCEAYTMWTMDGRAFVIKRVKISRTNLRFTIHTQFYIGLYLLHHACCDSHKELR